MHDIIKKIDSFSHASDNLVYLRRKFDLEMSNYINWQHMPNIIMINFVYSAHKIFA